MNTCCAGTLKHRVKYDLVLGYEKLIDHCLPQAVGLVLSTSSRQPPTEDS